MHAEKTIRELFSRAGVNIDGSEPHDLTVHDERFYRKVIAGGTLGVGEAYMDGWWDSNDLTKTIKSLLSVKISELLIERPYFILPLLWHRLTSPSSWQLLLWRLQCRLQNMQSERRSFIVGKKHYDIPVAFYKRMLGDELAYSCSFPKDDDSSLEEAQDHKMERVFKKLQIKPGMNLLDIGCGWGSFTRYAKQHHDFGIVGITISESQYHEATERELRDTSLPKIIYRAVDYRDRNTDFGFPSFNRIASVGMFEHAGPKNYRVFFARVVELLEDEGIFVLHTIGSTRKRNWGGDPWFDRHIFPNGVLPTVGEITEATNGRLVLQHFENFGLSYAWTLRKWRKNCEQIWEERPSDIPEALFGDRFIRMWRFYLSACEASFLRGNMHLWQFVFTKGVVPYTFTQ